jgi:DNA-binding transcriptional MocR family regulator
MVKLMSSLRQKKKYAQSAAQTLYKRDNIHDCHGFKRNIVTMTIELSHDAEPDRTLETDPRTDPGALWRPTIWESEEPLHVRLAETLSLDIRKGVLPPGARLPTHRELAYRLKIGVGTVTRAYALAESLGAVTSHVGRGTYVAEGGAAAQPMANVETGPIDLHRNLPPLEPAERRLRDAFTRLGRRRDLIEHMAYAPPAGFDAHRRAGAAWIARTTGGLAADWTKLLVRPGAQSAMTLAIAHLSKPGDTILTESGTFFVFRTLAEHVGYRLHGVAMDAEGIIPDALAEAVAKTGARILYLMPTLQNPTGRTMSLARREAIAALARRLDLTLVEDDVYAALALTPAVPIAALAPERTYYVGGVSKALAPGLRTGYLLAPTAEAHQALARAVRATTYAPPAFDSLIATQWIEDGTAWDIVADIRAELAARRALAAELLGPAIDPAADGAPHIWLPMGELEAERLAGRCLRAGVETTPPSAPIVSPDRLSGLRLCLGRPPTRALLRQALEVVADALAGGMATSASGVL